MNDPAWAKYLLTSIYDLWFYVFNLKMKQDFYSPVYETLTDYAICFLKELIYGSVILKEYTFRFVIEACGFY
jgi:hypothetical protein